MPYFKALSPSEWPTLCLWSMFLSKSTSYYHFISKFFYDKVGTSNSLGTTQRVLTTHAGLLEWRNKENPICLISFPYLTTPLSAKSLWSRLDTKSTTFQRRPITI